MSRKTKNKISITEIGCQTVILLWMIFVIIVVIIEAFSSCSRKPDTAQAPSPFETESNEPTQIPTPTPEPTPTPVPTPTPHPDYEKHYISRVELIDNYWNYSEAMIQKILDAYDYGYEDGYFDYEDEIGSYEDGYQDGHDDGYDAGYDEGYDNGYQQRKEDDSYDWHEDKATEERDWLY